MMKRIILISFSIFLLQVQLLFSQEKQEKISVSGYLSAMQSVMFDSLSGAFVNENIIHNRINLKGYLNDHITFAAEFRNRLFTGDPVKSGKSYSEMITADQGWMDMSWNLMNKNSFFLNTTVDRLWADFNYGKIEVKVGRQRINWGQTLVWNPNDIFNAYSFFDFDYVERPGSDAVRFQYYPNSSSTFEIAAKADYKNRVTAASLYRYNKGGYDVQFFAGYYNSSELTAGAGWSGSLGSVAFRGEVSWFRPIKHFSDASGTTIITIGFDKTFKNNSVAQMQFMYSNNPLNINLSDLSQLYNGNLSAENLAFSRFMAFGQYTYPVTPLLNIGASVMWFPQLKGFFTGPTIDWSVAENVDLSVIWQHFESSLGNENNRLNLGFLRFKISF